MAGWANGMKLKLITPILIDRNIANKLYETLIKLDILKLVQTYVTDNLDVNN